jgi:hypothetical protein
MVKYQRANFSAAECRDFAEQNTERAVQLTNYGINWMREIAEQNLEQNRAVVQNFLTIARNAVNDTDQRMSDFWQRSMLLAEETLDFAHKLVHVREPKELAHLQSEFLNQQAQALVDNAAEFGQNIMREADEMTKSAAHEAAESSRRWSQAA